MNTYTTCAQYLIWKPSTTLYTLKIMHLLPISNLEIVDHYSIPKLETAGGYTMSKMETVL